MRAILIAVTLLATTLGGCLDALNEGGASGGTPAKRTAQPRPVPGNMTSEASQAETAGPCPNQSSSQYPFCAYRTHWIEGDVSLASLPVDLSTFNGAVSVRGGPGAGWNLTVVLKAAGDSAETARSHLRNIEFTWSHEQSGGHFLKAQAKTKDGRTRYQESGSFTLIIPASVLVDLVARTSNGQVSAQALRGPWVELRTSNGAVSLEQSEVAQVRLATANGQVSAKAITVETLEADTSNAEITIDAQVRDATLSTANGQIEARLRPTASGKIVASTANGEVQISVPESSKNAYDADASTSIGNADITLKDGTTTGSRTSKHFRTNGYETREIQTTIEATTSNGNAEIGPL